MHDLFAGAKLARVSGVHRQLGSRLRRDYPALVQHSVVCLETGVGTAGLPDGRGAGCAAEEKP